MTQLTTKIIYNKPNVKSEHAIIWLHGLGADYNDFASIVPQLNLTKSVKFIFPNAPIIPITINGGMSMRGWYDILDFSDLHRTVDNKGIQKSALQTEELIEELIQQGFESKNIILAGFSQGGAICYYTALNSKYILGGMIILSSYLPDDSLIDKVNALNKKQLPILICHGTQDSIVNINFGKKALAILTKHNLKYEWFEYIMPHSVCAEEILQISVWLEKNLK